MTFGNANISTNSGSSPQHQDSSCIGCCDSNNPTLRVRVLTLNCDGLPLISKDRVARIHAIGDQLAGMELDLVGLQELWLESDRNTILAAVKPSGLKYIKYFRSGLLGSGLLILSRFPIDVIRFLRFCPNGSPEKFQHGDYYGGKGIGMVRVITPVSPIDFYNVHTIAQHKPKKYDPYFAHRVAQTYEIASFVNSESAGFPAVVVGDFNACSMKLEYHAVCTLAKLQDCYTRLHPISQGFTISSDNPYHDPESKSERIDYIFFRDGKESALKPLTATVGMKSIENIGVQSLRAFSDHYAVIADFLLFPKSNEELVDYGEDMVKRKVLDKVSKTLKESIEKARIRQRNQYWHSAISLVLTIFLFIYSEKLKAPEETLGFILRTIAIMVGVPYSVFRAWLGIKAIFNEIGAMEKIVDESPLQVIPNNRS